MNELLALLVNKVKSEPAVVVGILGSLIVIAAGHFGIILDEASLKEALEPLVGGLITRQFVVSATKHREALEEATGE